MYTTGQAYSLDPSSSSHPGLQARLILMKNVIVIFFIVMIVVMFGNLLAS